ncbi:MAG: gliding motility protein GldN, partial [Muribaculaceae bacterium]|nr:gliding motility protein GldN [Muribaculaceae bacterium]
LTAIILLIGVIAASAQESSSSAPVRRRAGNDRNRQTEQTPGITERMQGFYAADNSSLSEADQQWMRIIYRQIDLEDDKNAALYFPEEPIDGQENLFRIIMRLLASGQLKAYEYLDGREIFTEKYESKVKDILDRFYIIYTPAKGSTDKNPKFEIDEADVPSNEVLSYYVIEKWVYDTRNNRLKPTIEAICPVLHRAGDFGGDAVRYPMFWIKYSDLRPYLASQMIFVNDDNNTPTCTYDDFFNLNMYKGDIYKTRNLKNKSMAQLYPDPDDRKRAQDSIQARLDTFEDRLWTPTREELAARKAAEAELAAKAAGEADGDTPAEAVKETEKPAKSARASRGNSSTKKSTKKPAKVKESSASRSSSATRSVRRRK